MLYQWFNLTTNAHELVPLKRHEFVRVVAQNSAGHIANFRRTSAQQTANYKTRGGGVRPTGV